MTALLTYLVLAAYSRRYHGDKTDYDELMSVVRSIKILPDYIHPRDFLYMGYIQGKLWFWVWAFITAINPFLWLFNPFTLMMIMFIFMGLKKYKVRNGIKFFKTDTEILYWIRLRISHEFTFFKLSSYIIEPLLRRKYGDKDWFKRCIEMYYRDPNHPNRILVKHKEIK